MRSVAFVSLALVLAPFASACGAPAGQPDAEEPSASLQSADSTDNVICSHSGGGWSYVTMSFMALSQEFNGETCEDAYGGTLSEDVSNEFTQPIYTNNSANDSIWITIYDAGQTRQLDYGCVSAHSTRRWASGNYSWGSFYHVRAEVKANTDCTGDTLFDTIMQINPQFTHGQSFGGMTGDATDLVVDLVDTGTSYYLATGNDLAGPGGAFNGAPPSFDPGPFLLWSRVNGEAQVLSPDPSCMTAGCDLVIEPYTGSETQQWLRSWGDHGYLFTNVQTGLFAYVAPGQGSRVLLVTPSTEAAAGPTQYTWTIGGDFLSNFALRPLRDSSQNLNVFGDGPYPAGNAVGTWSWGGGAPNETWQATHVPAYRGCFVDNTDRVLPTMLIGGGATIGSCVGAAEGAGLAYAGLQYGGQCWAGSTMPADSAPDSDCAMPCTSAADEMCGSGWRNSVYSVH